MFSRVLPKSLPQSVLAPWRAVLTAGFPRVWANIPRLSADPFVLDSRSFAPFPFRPAAFERAQGFSALGECSRGGGGQRNDARTGKPLCFACWTGSAPLSDAVI